jgi:hypothetical protein
MPSASQLYPSAGGRFLRAADLQQDIGLNNRHTVLIHAVTIEDVPDNKTGGTKTMLCIDMVDARGQTWQKGYLLNKTNMMQLVSAYGDNYEKWPGNAIQIWVEIGPMGNQRVAQIKLIGVPKEMLQSQKPAQKPSAMKMMGVAAAPVADPDADLNDEVPF